MRFIEDEDLGRLERALKDTQMLTRINGPMSRNYMLANNAYFEISEVLDSIRKLDHPAPHQEPKIVALSEKELQNCYPERFTSQEKEQQ